MLQNILNGLGGGQGFLQALMGGGQGGLLGMLGGGGGQPAPAPGQQPQDNSMLGSLGLGQGLLSQPGQSPLQTFGHMMEPMGLLQMIMKGLQ